MEEEHTFKYEGLEMTVIGNWEQQEEYTGYPGGWSTEQIKVNDVDIYWMLKPNVIDIINRIVIEVR